MMCRQEDEVIKKMLWGRLALLVASAALSSAQVFFGSEILLPSPIGALARK
jgi:hypothetical protein